MHALEPHGRLVDLSAQRGFALGVLGAQRLELARMRGLRRTQALLGTGTGDVALDGRAGTNRARGAQRQIAADTDLEAVRLWLAEYAGSPHTLRSYRKEAVRLIVWTTRVLNKALSSLTREDFLLYERFLAAPTADWTDPALPRRGGARRLFDGPLAEHSRRQALGILSGLFNYLVAAGYVAGNALALRRARHAGIAHAACGALSGPRAVAGRIRRC